MDFDSAQRMLQGSLLQFPDLSFVFLSNAIDTFYQMVGIEDVGNGRMQAKLVRKNTYLFKYIWHNPIPPNLKRNYLNKNILLAIYGYRSIFLRQFKLNIKQLF